MSGEALSGDDKSGINPAVVKNIAEEVKEVHDRGVETGGIVRCISAIG